MKKNILTVLLSAACFTAVSAAAYADGPVAGAGTYMLRTGDDNIIDNIGDAAGDVIDGAADGVGDVADGVGDAAGDIIDGVTDGAGELLGDGDGDGDDAPETPADLDGAASEDAPAAGTSDETPAESVGENSASNGAANANPATGVPFGFTAAAAVITAVAAAATAGRKPR